MPYSFLRRFIARPFRPVGRKVLGVGWAKTGTTSLGLCLTRLGCRHVSRRLDLVDGWSRGDCAEILSIAKRHDSFEDWPWLLLYREFDTAFPGTKFILTTRDSKSWIKSYLNQIYQPGHFTPEMNRLRELLYGLSFENLDPDKLIARYEAHNTAVREYFRNRPSDLLEVNWADGHGWKEVCGFLGEQCPNEVFPHAHKGIYRTVMFVAGLIGHSMLDVVGEVALTVC